MIVEFRVQQCMIADFAKWNDGGSANEIVSLEIKSMQYVNFIVLCTMIEYACTLRFWGRTRI